jgi:hypothetical protein
VSFGGGQRGVTSTQLAITDGKGVATMISLGHASSKMVVWLLEPKKAILEIETCKSLYKEVLIGSSKDNHDHARALARHFSNRGGTRKDNPKFPARGDCRTTSVTVARVRG